PGWAPPPGPPPAGPAPGGLRLGRPETASRAGNVPSGLTTLSCSVRRGFPSKSGSSTTSAVMKRARAPSTASIPILLLMRIPSRHAGAGRRRLGPPGLDPDYPARMQPRQFLPPSTAQTSEPPPPERSPASDPTPSPDPSPVPDPKPAPGPQGPPSVPGVIPPPPAPRGGAGAARGRWLSP